MNTISDHPECPRCGTPVPADAPGGQCPRCLLGAVAAATEPPAPPPATGEWPTLDEVQAAFPDLEVEEEIGRGGMAVVFKARQLHLDRSVALKILAPWLAAEPGFSERFSREARVLAKLNHPNIVTIHDFGQAARFFYLLMEYVDGVNLRQAMQVGRFAPEQALGLVPKICDALQYAHGEGVLHRDIKPDNILLDARGRVKIADFGIAKLAGEKESAFSLTRSGMRLGTPAYMAPEQVEKPADVDHRADIYSLGVVLYEMLTGELPLGRFAAPSEKSSVDARIDEIVFRTLEKERERRYQSAEEVKTRVEGLGSGPAVAGVAAAAGSRGTSGGADAPFDETPLSKKALWGAVSTALSLCGMAVLVPSWTMPVMRVSYGRPDHGESTVWMAGAAIVGVLLLAGMVAAALSGALLGASALSDIRRSGGRLRGAGLATFAVVSWPFLILTGVSVGLAATLGEELFRKFRVPLRGWLMVVSVTAGIGGALSVAVFLVRKMLRWARGGVGGLAGHRPMSPPPPPPATAATLVSTPTPPTSGLALAGGLLTLLSALPLALILGIVALAGGRGTPMVGLGYAEILILLIVCALPGVVGTILGVVAMRRIRESGGRMGGVGWAVFGGFAWPMLVLALFALNLSFWVLARTEPGGFGVLLGFLCGLGLPFLVGIYVFRSAAAWTRGTEVGRMGKSGARWAVGLTVVGLAAAGLVTMRVRQAAGPLAPTAPTAPTAPGRWSVLGAPEDRVDAGRSRIVVNEAKQTSEWTSERPVQVQRFDLNVAATLDAHRQLVCEVRHARPGGREFIVNRIDDAWMLTGELASGPITVHRHFVLPLPEGAGTDALQEAHRQINAGWLHRGRSVLLGRPERLFLVPLADGSSFEATFVLLPSESSP